MAQERTEAVVLRRVDFSETSQIVAFLTPDRGKVACMAKGVRRPKSPLAGVLDTFNRLEIVYYWRDGRQVQNLAEASLLDAYEGVKRDLRKAAYAGFPLELAYKTAHENEPSPALFAALTRGLAGLAQWQGDVATHACWQALHLLAAAGFAPELSCCVHCGASGALTGFSYDGGGVCARCRADVALTAPDAAALTALAGAETACPAAAVSPAAFRVLGRYAARQFEADFRSVRVIDEMFGRD